MIKLYCALLSFFFCSSLPGNAQDNLPTDYLSPSFHAARREALRKLMPDHAVMVVFAYPERVFSRDINYPYHPNPDLYYLTGYKEPDAVLLIFKDTQHKGNDAFNELFYVRKRNALLESWTGRRLGAEGVKNKLGIANAYTSDDFKDIDIDFSAFSKIIYDVFPDDAGSGTLQSLMKTLQEKIPSFKPENKFVVSWYNLIASNVFPSNLENRVNRLSSSMSATDDAGFRNDPILNELIQHPDTATLSKVKMEIKNNPSPSIEFTRLMSLLREIKMPEELVLLRKSINLSAIAHVEAMKAIKPDMSESEITGIFEYVHRKYGAEWEGYPPIVGAGANGCILHYIDNNATMVNNQLVLMDVAAEYHGYSADITRTVPANGKFTKEQEAIYQLVYDAQEEVMKIAKEGTPFPDLNQKATEVLANGLIKLGIIQDKNNVSKYYLHSCSHHMGLDVHDRNITPVLKENMVITVEPGIYINANSPCDPKWWNIAVRIEDDVLIGKNGCENLSAGAPRKVKDIEAMMYGNNAFSNMDLPSLK